MEEVIKQYDLVITPQGEGTVVEFWNEDFCIVELTETNETPTFQITELTKIK